jgi:hypothetical protein
MIKTGINDKFIGVALIRAANKVKADEGLEDFKDTLAHVQPLIQLQIQDSKTMEVENSVIMTPEEVNSLMVSLGAVKKSAVDCADVVDRQYEVYRDKMEKK